MKTHLAVRWLMLVSMFIYSLGPEPLWANPVGGTVVEGSATISSNGNTLTVNQSTNRAIIDWQSFSINNGELTKFIQPNSSSADLSRVTGVNPSQLLGALQSNGQIYLINPNGIVFGQGFQLNTAGFLASTLDVSNAAFMSGGNLQFTGSSTAGITNNASLTGIDGDFFLFARSVTNNGAINANGTVGLAAGSDILLASSGDQRVFIQAGSQPGTVINKGSVQAVAAELKAVGGNAGALAINNTGTVRATGVKNKGGHIYLVAINGDVGNSGSLVAQDSQGNGGTILVQASSDTPTVTPATVTNSGTIDASGTATGSSVGGSVVVTGDNVHLTSTSLVNVAGNAGGGTALIGGGSHGKDPGVLDAQTTTVDPGARIVADSLLSGNGGNVTVWSNNDTEYFGNISARGGALAGDGGNVEVSGGHLNFQGAVNTLAAHGKIGNLLLDPTDVLIETVGTQDAAYTAAEPNGPFTGGSGTPSVLLVGTLQTALASSNVTVDTGGTGAVDGGDITVANAVTWASNQALTLTAGNEILINAALSSTSAAGNAAAINLNAGAGGVSITSPISLSSTADGALTINTTGGVTETGAGSITAQTLYLEGSGTANLQNTNNVPAISTNGTTYNGLIQFNNGVNNLTVGDGSNGIVTNGTGVDLTTTGTLALGKGINTGASGTVILNIGGTVSGAGGAAADITAGTLDITGTGDVGTAFTVPGQVYTNVGTIDVNPTTTSGNFYINQSAGTPVTLEGSLASAAAGKNFYLTSGNSITLGSTFGENGATGSEIVLTGTALGLGNFNLSEGNTGNIVLINSGNVTGTGSISAAFLGLGGTGSVGTGTANRIATNVGTLAVDSSTGNIYLNQTGALNLEGAGFSAGGAGATTLDILGTAGLTFTGTLALSSGSDAVLRFNGGTITGQGAATDDINFGSGAGSGTVELLAGTGISQFQDDGNGVTLAFKNATSGNVNITSFGGTTGTTIQTTANVASITNPNGAITVVGGSPVNVNSSMTATGIALSSMDDQAGGNNNITIGPAAAVTLNATGSAGVTIFAGNSVVVDNGSTIEATGAGGNAGNVALQAQVNQSGVGGSQNDGLGNITLNNGIITSSGGDVALIIANSENTSAVTAATISQTGGQINALTGLEISAEAGNGAVTTTTLTAGSNKVGTIAINSLGGVSYTDKSTLTVGDVDVTDGATLTSGNLSLTAASLLTVADTTNGVNTSGGNGTITLTGVGVTQNGGTTINSGTGQITINGAAGAVELDGAVDTSYVSGSATDYALTVEGSTITQATTGAFNVPDGTALFLSTAAADGSVAITNNGDLTLVTSNLTTTTPPYGFIVGGNLTVTLNNNTLNQDNTTPPNGIAVAGTVTLSGVSSTNIGSDPANVFGGAYTDNNGNVTINRVGPIVIGNGSGESSLPNPVAGNLNITSLANGYAVGATLVPAAITLNGTSNGLSTISVQTAQGAGAGYKTNQPTSISQDTTANNGTINMTNPAAYAVFTTQNSTSASVANTGNITLTAAGDNQFGVTRFTTGTAASQTGNVSILASNGNLVLGDVANVASTAKGNVLLEATNGSLSENTAADLLDVSTGKTLKLYAESIGAVGTPFMTTGSYTVQAIATTGDLVLENSGGDVTVATVTGGPIDTNGLDATNGEVSFLNNTDPNAITLNAPVIAGNSIDLEAGSNLSTSSGAVTINSLSSSISLMADNGFISLKGAVGSSASTDVTILADTTLTTTGGGASINGSGNIQLTTTTGAISLGGAVGGASTTTVTVNSDTSLTTSAAAIINAGTSISLTSGTTMALGANVGSTTTGSVTISNGGNLSRSNGSVVSGAVVTLEGAGGIENSGPNAAGIDVNTTDLNFNKTSTTPLWVSSIGTGTLPVSGVFDGGLFLTAAGSIQIGDTIDDFLDDTNLLGNDVIDLRSTGGSIVAQDALSSITFDAPGGGLDLQAGGTNTVGMDDGHALDNGSTSANALQVVDVSTLSGVANGGFYVVNTSLGTPLTIGTVTSPLGTTNGITANAGAQVNTDGDLTVSKPVTSSNGYIQLVGDGTETINALVSSGSNGSGTLVTNGSPIINVPPTLGNADIYLSDGNPNAIFSAPVTITNGNWILEATNDVIIQAAVGTSGGNLTLDADMGDTGSGGVLISNGGGHFGQAFATNGSINIFGSNLLTSGNDSTGNVSGHQFGGLNGNAVVFNTSNVNGALKATAGSVANSGTVTININGGQTGAVVQDIPSTSTATQITANTLVFNGDGVTTGQGNIGIAGTSGAINPIQTNVANLVLNKVQSNAQNTVYLNEFNGINISQASTVGDLVIYAGIHGSGDLTQSPGGILTANNLTAVDENGNVTLTQLNNVNTIDLGYAKQSFDYSGAVDLTLDTGTVPAINYIYNGHTGVTASADVNINVGTDTLTQDFGAPIDGQTVELTFGAGSEGDVIGSTTTASVTISNAGLFTQSNASPALIEASLLNLNDQTTQVGGNDDVGVSGTPILTAVSSLNFNRENYISNMYLSDSKGVTIHPSGGVATSLGSLTLAVTNALGGNINEAGAITLDNAGNTATLSLSTANGYINLASIPGVGNSIDAFGVITAKAASPATGYFAYDGTGGSFGTGLLTDVLQLNGAINATGNVSINMGNTLDILQSVNAPINAPGEIATPTDAGSITFGFFDGTFNAPIGNPTSAKNNNTNTTPPNNSSPVFNTSTDGVAFYNADNLTLNSGANVVARDSVTEYDNNAGFALVDLGANITTEGASGPSPVAASITFQSAVVLVPSPGAPNPTPGPNPITLNADQNVATHGNILFEQTLDGTIADQQNLTAEARNGNITFTGVVGGVTAPGNIVAETNGTTSFGTSSSIITVEANSITTEGAAWLFGSPTTAEVNAGNTTLYATTITSDNYNNAISGITGGQVYGNPTVLENVTGPGTGTITQIALDGPPPSNNIYYLSTLDGATPGGDNLILTPVSGPDIGNIGFVGAVGGNVRLGNVTITDANNVDVNRTQGAFVGFGGFTAETLTQQASTAGGTTTFGLVTSETGSYPGEGAIDLSGSIGLTPALGALPADYTANATAPTDAALYLNGNNFTFNAGASTNTSATGTGTTGNGHGNVIINITTSNGQLNMVQGADMGFNADAGTPGTPGLAGQFIELGDTSTSATLGNTGVTMGNNITTQGDVVYFESPVTFNAVSTSPVINPHAPPSYLDASLINTTGSGHANGANIVFDNALNGTSEDNSGNGLNNVNLNAGGASVGNGGNINFYGPAGTGAEELGDLVIINANNVDLNSNNIKARDFYQAAGQGTTTVNGTITTSSAAPNQTVAANNTSVATAVITPTSASSFITLPSAGSPTTGGTQVNTQYIIVQQNITADNGGVISLIASGTPGTPTPANPPNTTDALLIENGSTLDADAGGNIVLTTTSTTGADVHITDGSVVETTSSGTGTISITASDDVVDDGTGGVTEGVISTFDGGISITADNDLLDNSPTVGADNANGVLIEATNDADGVLVSANGALGTLTITSTVKSDGTTPNDGELVILGGTVTGAFATVQSTANQTVTVAGGPATTIPQVPLTGSDQMGVYVAGGSGLRSAATLQTTTTTADQSITANTGDVTVQGGSDYRATATISSDSQASGTGSLTAAQYIDVANGNLNVLAGSIWNTQATISANSAAATQVITVSSPSGGSEGNISVTAAGSNALISNGTGELDTNNQDITADQTITLTGSNLSPYTGSATVEAGGNQTIVAGAHAATSGNIVAQGGTQFGGRATIVSFGNNTSNTTPTTQSITVDNAGSLAAIGNLTVQGGDGAHANALIQADNTTQNITVNYGALNILADNVNANAGNATVEDVNTNGVQTVDVTHGGILVEGGQGSDTATLITTGSDSQQNINLFVAGNFDVYSGEGTGANATVESDGLNSGTNDAQAIDIADGSFNIVSSEAGATANNNSVAKVDVNNGGVATQDIVVDGTGGTNGQIFIIGGYQNTNGATGTGLAAIVSSSGFGSGTAGTGGGLSQTITAQHGITIDGGGANGAGSNDNGEILASGVDSQQLVQVTLAGNIYLNGGDGQTANALIEADGNNESGTAQQVLVDNGNLSLTGGSDPTTAGSAYILSTNTAGGDTNTNTQYINVKGSINLLGGTGTTGDAYITSDGFGPTAGPGTAQNIIAQSGVSLTGGTGTSSTAYIQATGTYSTQKITVNTDNLALTGGNGANSAAYVEADGLEQIIQVSDGELTVTGNQDAANDGSYALIDTTLATSVQHINVEGTPSTTVGNIILTGGLGNGEYAAITAANNQYIGGPIAPSQTDTLITGNITLQGGGTATSTGDYAAITAVSSQGIDLTGVLTAKGSADSTVAGNDDYALIYGATDKDDGSGSSFVTQNITAGAGIILEGQDGNSSAPHGDFDSIGAAIIADNTQQVDATTTGGILIEGGTIAGSAAGIDDTAKAGVNTSATQNVFGYGTNTGGYGITLAGGSAGDGDEALIYSGNTGAGFSGGSANAQYVYGDQGILITGNGASSGDGATINQGFGDFTSIGAGIVATNNQGVDSGEGLTMLGGTVAGSAAVIDLDAPKANQTLNVYGSTLTHSSDGIYLQGGTAHNGDEALIYSAATTGTQTIESYDSGTELQANQATSTFSVTTSEGRTYDVGAGIEANSQQILTVANDNLTLQGGSATQSSAIIAMLNTGSTQTISVDSGGLSITGGSDTPTPPAAGTLSGAGILSVGVDGSSTLAQQITVYFGNITLTADQLNTSGSENDAFIDLFAANTPNYSATSATQLVTDGVPPYVGPAPLPGYITLQGGVGTSDYAYLESTAVQTITDTGGQTAPAPFLALSPKLGLGVAGGSGTTDYAIVKSDRAQTITIDPSNDGYQGDIQVLGGSGTDDVAAIHTTDTGTGSPFTAGTQTIAIGDGNLVVNGGTGSVTTPFDAGYFASNAAVDSEAAQVITVDNTSPATNGNITVTGGTGQGGAANVESLNTQTIGTSLTTTPASNNPIAGTITVQGGGTAGGAVTGDYAAISSNLAQNINVTGNLLVLGSTTATAPYNDDYAAVATLENQTINVGGYVHILAQSGSSDGNANPNPGPLGDAGVPTGLGAVVVAFNQQGDGAQDITIKGADSSSNALTVEGGSNGVNQTAAGIEQSDTTSDQQILVTDTTPAANILIEGGTDINGYALVDSQNTQEIGTTGSPITGDVTVQGGGMGTNTGAYAAITSTFTQKLNITGNLDVYGSHNADTPETAAANDDYALVYTPATQTIAVNGGIVLDAYQGSSSAAHGDLTSIGAAIIADNTQLITTTHGGILLQGGTLPGSAAAIDETAITSNQATQTINASGLNSTSNGITLEGGSAGDGDEALVYSGNTGSPVTPSSQTIETYNGGILLQSNGASSGDGATIMQGFGDFASIGTGIVATNSQQITTLAGGLTLQGGSVAGSAAVIDEAATVTSAIQTLNIHGTTLTNPAYGIILQGGTAGNGDEAVIFSNNTTGAPVAQSIEAFDAGMEIDANGALSDLDVTTSEIYPAAGGPYRYYVGAGILAHNTQSIKVDQKDLYLQGASNANDAPGSAIIGMLNTGAVTQTIMVGNGNLTIQAGNNADPAMNIGAAAGILSYGVGNGAVAPAQDITVLGNNTGNGNLTLTASQDADGASYLRDAFIDLFADLPNFNNTTAVQSVSVGQNTPSPIAGYISLQAGSGLGDYAYLSSNAIQTIFAEGGTPTSGPFSGIPLGLGVTANATYVNGIPSSGNEALVHSDGTQTITVETGNVEVIGGSPLTGGNDVAGIFTTGQYTGTQTISIGSATGTTNDNGNLVVSGGGTGVSANQYVDGDSDYFASAALVGSAGAQLITVDNTSAAARGNITVTGGTGQGGAANIESNDTQTIGTSGVGANPIAGSITVQGGQTVNFGAYAAISSALTQKINVAGNLLVLGSNTAVAPLNDDYAAIASLQDQTITVGGYMHVYAQSGSSDAANNNAAFSPGPLAIAPTGLGAVVVALNQQTDGLQDITVNGGNLEVVGGSNGVGQTAAVIEQSDTSSDQNITATDGSILVTGGQDNNGYAQIDSQNTQEITLTHANDSITVQAGGTGVNLAHAAPTTGAYAAITATSSQDIELTPAGDNFNVYGSNPTTPLPAGDSNNDNYAVVLTLADQTIDVGGSMTVNAYQGSSASNVGPLQGSPFVGADAVGAMVIAEVQGAGDQFQDITVTGGALTVQGGSTGVGTAGGATGALIEQDDVASDQQILVTDATPANVLVAGGTDINGYAQIDSQNTQEIGTTTGTPHPITGSVMVEAGGTAAHAGAYAAITSSEAQTFNVNGDVDVTGTTAANANNGNNDYALVQSGDLQTLTIGGSLDIAANQGSSSGAGPMGTAGLGAAVIANDTQNIEVGNISATGVLSVLGGTTSGSGASLQMNGTGDNQQIDVYGVSTSEGTTGDSVDVVGGTGANAYASILSTGNQELGNNFGGPIAGNVIVQAGSGGSVTGGAYATIQSGSGAGDYYQAIYSSGSIKVLANTVGSSAGGGYASLISYGYQDIESYGGTGISVTGGATSGDSALVETYNTAGDNEQLIYANGNANDNITVSGGGGANAFASVVDANSDGASGHGQDIESYGNTGISVTAGSGTGSYASLDMQAAQGFQYIQAHGTGAIALQDGNGGDAFINSDAQEQSVEAGGNITLTANHHHLAYISGAGTQTIKSDNGVLNMTGTGVGGGASITAVDPSITIGGSGTSTWTGNSVIGTDGVTDMVHLKNNGPIVLVGPAPTANIYANANPGTSTISFDGAGSIGSVTNPLITETEIMNFNDNPTKNIFVTEAQSVGGVAVALEGTLNDLDLNTTGAGLGNVTNAGPLVASQVSITTADGGVILTGTGNNVAAFEGFVAGQDAVNAQGAGGEFWYVGGAGQTNVNLDGLVNAGSFITVDVGGGPHTITLNNGFGGVADPSLLTSVLNQLYNGNLVLNVNNTTTAGTPGTNNEAITYAGTVAGGGVNSLTINAGNATFEQGAGTLLSPLYNLTFAAGTIANFNADGTPTPVIAPGDMALVDPALFLNHSLINNGTLNLADATPITLVVDNGTVGPGSGVFQGGVMNVTNLANLVIYGANPAGVTGSSLPANQVYSAWYGAPNTLIKPYALATIFYKAVPQNIIIPFPELTTFALSNDTYGLYTGYQLGGDANNPGGGVGDNGGNGGPGVNGGNGDENGSQNPGTLAGTQQYPFSAVINVAGYGPGSDDGDGQVWIGSGAGYLTFGSSDELNAGSNASLFPPDEKHYPKKLKHKPVPWAVPQAGSSGSGQ